MYLKKGTTNRVYIIVCDSNGAEIYNENGPPNDTSNPAHQGVIDTQMNTYSHLFIGARTNSGVPAELWSGTLGVVKVYDFGITSASDL